MPTHFQPAPQPPLRPRQRYFSFIAARFSSVFALVTLVISELYVYIKLICCTGVLLYLLPCIINLMCVNPFCDVLKKLQLFLLDAAFISFGCCDKLLGKKGKQPSDNGDGCIWNLNAWYCSCLAYKITWLTVYRNVLHNLLSRVSCCRVNFGFELFNK